jgi:hypothetical protein
MEIWTLATLFSMPWENVGPVTYAKTTTMDLDTSRAKTKIAGVGYTIGAALKARIPSSTTAPTNS